jgi:hypothetical protein
MKALPVSFFLNETTGFLLCFLTMFVVTMPLGFLFPLLTHFLKLTRYSPQKISSHLYVWNTCTSSKDFGQDLFNIKRRFCWL